jgi:Family of unknown function (DUF6272)
LKTITDISTNFFQKYHQSITQLTVLTDELIVDFIGELSQEAISKLEADIESRALDLALPKQTLKKLFFISVETLQNMLIHGAKLPDSSSNNIFVISKRDNDILIKSANLISQSEIQKIRSHLELINGFEDEKSLKEFYISNLSNSQMSAKGGAGLGFITIAMKSGNKLKYEFHELDTEYSVFFVEVNILSI